MGCVLWTPQVHASMKICNSVPCYSVLPHMIHNTEPRMWYLATTSALVVGNVDMVELPVSRDSMFHFVVCSLGTACRGVCHSPVPLPNVNIKRQWKNQRRVDLV